MRFILSTIRQRWSSQPPLSRCLMVAFLVSNVGWLFLFKMLYSNHTATALHPLQEKQTALSNQLIKIEQHLKQLSSVEQKQQQAHNQQWAALQQQLHELQQNTKSLASYQEWLQRIESLQQTLLTKVNSITPVSKTIDTTAKPIPVLSRQALPFSVLGIDIWNGVPKVTVRLQKQLNLLGVNDTLAGWTVIDINSEAGSAVFKNAKQQQVKIVL